MPIDPANKRTSKNFVEGEEKENSMVGARLIIKYPTPLAIVHIHRK